MIFNIDLNFCNNHQYKVDLEVTIAMNNKTIIIKGHLHPIKILSKILTLIILKLINKYNSSKIFKKMINNNILLINLKNKFKIYKWKI
jgi:hypothetical protein